VEVVYFTERDRQAYTAYGICSLARHDPI
jgi:hypothetical protein